jgi:hypothetical protein
MRRFGESEERNWRGIFKKEGDFRRRGGRISMFWGATIFPLCWLLAKQMLSASRRKSEREGDE